jgi:hypothetical protein
MAASSTSFLIRARVSAAAIGSGAAKTGAAMPTKSLSMTLAMATPRSRMPRMRSLKAGQLTPIEVV